MNEIFDRKYTERESGENVKNEFIQKKEREKQIGVLQRAKESIIATSAQRTKMNHSNRKDEIDISIVPFNQPNNLRMSHYRNNSSSNSRSTPTGAGTIPPHHDLPAVQPPPRNNNKTYNENVGVLSYSGGFVPVHHRSRPPGALLKRDSVLLAGKNKLLFFVAVVIMSTLLVLGINQIQSPFLLVLAQQQEDLSCPTTPASFPYRTITVAGTGLDLMNAWAGNFTNQCRNVTISIIDSSSSSSSSSHTNFDQELGSMMGSRLVCGHNLLPNETVVDVGVMSRDWKNSEATTKDRYTYQCTSDPNRQVIQMDVAVDAVIMVTYQGGLADKCIQLLGGLTVDQLRWIYSNRTVLDLVNSGWNISSVPNLDGDDSTHLWSELNPNCAQSEILISGTYEDLGTYDYFQEVLFGNHKNQIPFTGRSTDHTSTNSSLFVNSTLLGQYLQNNSAAIGFAGYGFLLQDELPVEPVPIFNGVDFVSPDSYEVYNGLYIPFSRRIRMNVLNDPFVLTIMRPFFSYVYNDSGSMLLDMYGYFPIPEWEQQVMLTRIMAPGGTNLSNVDCPPTNGGRIRIGGSSTVKPIADIWAGIYQVKCYNTEIIVEEGTSSTIGASRICTGSEGQLDIVDMSRSFKAGDNVNSTDGYRYHCSNGLNRTIMQLAIAIDGLTMATQQGGIADKCIRSMGGLTVDQLRWMFSNLTEDQLKASGWDTKSVPYSDGNPNTHKWIELNTTCSDTEILLSGPGDQSGIYDFFRGIVFTGPNENFAYHRGDPYFISNDPKVLVNYLRKTSAAIGYVGYTFYSQNRDTLSAAAIRNNVGSFIPPNDASVQDGSYNPFTHTLYMNLLQDTVSLERTRPFLDFGLSVIGDSLVRFTGFSTINKLDQVIMLTRAQTKSGTPLRQIIPCPPPGGQIKIAGSATVFPIARLWGTIYQMGCDVNMNITGRGSAIGALRVCGGGEGVVDIGDMSRDWQSTEAQQLEAGSHFFRCAFYDTSRSVIQVLIAVDGISVVARAGSIAQQCIQLMNGLTTDQLRWLFSSYTQQQLIATGWKPWSLPNSDGDDNTHKWSELNENCADVEALISGHGINSGTHAYFRETILTDWKHGEDFCYNRKTGFYNSALDEVLIAYLLENSNAISFVGYSYYYQNQGRVFASPIQDNHGNYIPPSDETIHNGTYIPLSRRLFMNLFVETKSLAQTVPFIRFGFSAAGRKLIDATGYVNIPETIAQQYLSYLDEAIAAASGQWGSDDNSFKPGGIVGIMIACFIGLVFAMWVFFRKEPKGFASAEGSPEAPL